ncbi:RNA exonuclease [Sodiomyces alkalinus F11]|uniref:RNA exonuclease n=1 Tax=Sodiomyces alkalinus (strain CBS 110278 / VKM F-3762 / F11) TaxID=1314773 RepID=A0A3N2PMF9_SODAK|nr:RNA exonuclease [Sodiomyces alkalinus F11]ROT35610.1 RNA exonuclease [Sodiomyces alkalinus F11]
MAGAMLRTYLRTYLRAFIAKKQNAKKRARLEAEAFAAAEAATAALAPGGLADTIGQLQVAVAVESEQNEQNEQKNDAVIGQEENLAGPGASSPDVSSSTSQSSGALKRAAPHDEQEDDGGGWQKVERASKKAKKIPRDGSNSYPAISFFSAAKLYSKINIAQLRDLILYIFADGPAPQWVAVQHRPQFRKIVVVTVPGLEEAMFTEKVNFDTYNSTPPKDENRSITSPDDFYPRLLKSEWLPDVLKPFVDMFPHLWPVRAPGDDKHMKLHSPLGTFLTAPLPKDKAKGVKAAKEPHGWKNERTRITEYLASEEELESNGHLLHPALIQDPDRRAAFQPPQGWVATRVESLEDAQVPEEEVEQGSVTAGRDCLALDCEMCMTGEDEYSLTRISVLAWSGEIIMDELVKPEKPITNYVTHFSGITEAMLAPVTITLQDIQARLLDLITPRTILIGHSLESDLKALRLSHPFIVDTSLIYPHPRGPPLKSSLKWLTQKYLHREIQRGGAQGHNPVEDARACLDLVRQKCEKGKLWGTSDAQGENLFRRLARAGTSYKAQAGESALGGLATGKSTAAIDWGEPSKGPGAGATHRIGCKSDEDVVQGVIRAVQGDPDGREIRGGGVDFVWARMRELEAHQGWWNTNRSDQSNSDGGPPSNTDPRNGDGGDTDPALQQHQHQQQQQHQRQQPQLADENDADPRSSLEQCLARLTDRLQRIHAALPKCTAFIVFSGSGDPREMARLQALHAQWKREYNTPGRKWDQLSVKWTDAEDQALRRAVRRAREGIGFVSVK